MTLLLSYSKLYILQLFRNRSAVFFQLFFPALLLLLFGRQHGNSQIENIGTFVVFCNYCIQTATFLSLAFTVSSERSSDWTIFLRTLPARSGVQFGGMIVSKLMLGILSLLFVSVVGYFLLKLNLPFETVAFVFVVALLGGIPMGMLGIGIGTMVNALAARSFLVFINLCLLFGAFIFPDKGILSVVRDFVPTYQWMMITLSHQIPGANRLEPWAWMLGWTVVLYLFMNYAHKRRRDLRQG